MMEQKQTFLSYSLSRFWLFGPLCGLVFAGSLTLVISIWEWIENPGGIFRGENGTNWNFVYDTASSWFIPSFINVTILASVGHVIFSLVKRRKQKNEG